MNGCGKRPAAESNGNDVVIDGVLKKNTTSDPGSLFSVVVLQSETAEDRYCLVPPLGRNPFAHTPLEETHVGLHDSIRELSNAIRALPPSVRVDAADPDFCQPSRYKLRPLTGREFDEVRKLLGR